MHCRTCGIPNADDAAICVSCGADLNAQREQAAQMPVASSGTTPAGPPPPPQPYPSQPVAQPVAIPNYLVQSILVTLCCCLPAGIPAIIFAAQVDSKARVGDIAGAMQASKNAKTFCWISFGLGMAIVVWQVLWLLLGLGSAFIPTS